MASLIYFLLIVPILILREKFARGSFPLSAVVVLATLIIFPNFSDASVELYIGVGVVSLALVLLDLRYLDQSPKENGRYYAIPFHLGIFAWALIVFNFFAALIDHGGIVDMLLRNRLQYYLNTGITSKSAVDSIASAAMPFVYLTIGHAIENRRKWLALAMVSGITFYLIATANTRFSVIIPIIAFGLFAYSNLEGEKRVRWILGVFAALPLGVPFLNLTNYFRLGRVEDIDLAGIFNFAKIEAQLGYSNWFNDLVDYLRQTGDYAYGYYWGASQLVNLVPRFFWPEKPITSVSNILSIKVYGADIGFGEAVTTFTIYGEAYWQFSYIGFFILPIITFFSFYYFRRFLEKIQGGRYVYAVYLAKFFAVVRAESIFFHMMWIVILFGTMVYFEKLLRRVK